jgi:hypothetical protein
MANDYVSPLENHFTSCFVFYPFNGTKMKVPPVAATVAVCSGETISKKTMDTSNVAWQMENAAVRGYGKLECRKDRKIGRVKLMAAHMEEELDTSNLLFQGSTTQSTATTKVTTGQCFVYSTRSTTLFRHTAHHYRSNLPGMVVAMTHTSTRHWCNLSRRRHCP